MKKLLLIATLFFATPVIASEDIAINGNKFCADAVGIPYASDNFTDEEWNEFQKCLEILSDYKVY